MDTELQQQLEILLDEHGGLAAVLDALAMLCFEKAERLKANRQDPLLAGIWEAAGGHIAKLASQIDL